MYIDFLKPLKEKIDTLGCSAITLGCIDADLLKRTFTQSLDIITCGSILKIEYSTTDNSYRITDSVSKEIKEFVSQDPIEAVDYVMSIIDELKDNFLKEIKELVDNGEF